MEGRGYVNGGSAKAAEFIAHQYDSLGLGMISDSYSQDFLIKVNHFPGKMSLKINEEELIPGVDYLVDPQSGSGMGKNFTIKSVNIFKGKQLDKLLKDMYSIKETVLQIELSDTLSSQGRMLFMQTVFLLCEQWPVMLLSDEKLTWSIANSRLANPLFIVHKKSFKGKDKVSFNVESELKSSLEKNVIASIKGNQKKDSYIIISAHYDHLGRMGSETLFPGANDNASGIAIMLALAAELKKSSPEHSILLIAFAAEEAGLLGSTYFVEHPLVSLDSIDFVLNLDINGTGEEGITVVNATEFPEQFELLKQSNEVEKGISDIKARGPAANSDHYPFYTKGVPSFFIYTRGGIKAYHDIYDRPETLPLNKATALVELYKDFILTLDKTY
jgi:aminopeptidase YwaD